MNKIYDNGALMLGNVQMVIMEIERQKRASIDMLDVEMDELLKDLKELRDSHINAKKRLERFLNDNPNIFK